MMYFDNRGEYFDSFREEPRKTFELYLNKHCNVWIRNERALQSILSSFCGHYYVFYCLFKYLNYDITAITNVFINDTAFNDYIVHKFVCDGL